MIRLVRPSLGNPLILDPDELQNFEITVAYKKDWINGKEERDEAVPDISTSGIERILEDSPPKVGYGNLWIPLSIKSVHSFCKYSKFEDNYSAVRHAVTNEEQQYLNGYRWEARVTVGINNEQIRSLKGSSWPRLLNLQWKWTEYAYKPYTVINYHAIYVHETLKSSGEFTILHITDTHIAKKNDLIPEILCQVRNKKECENLKKRYVNFNDHLRAFIKEANNRVVKNGEKVIVVLTGDITDYYFDGYWDGKFICGQGDPPGWPDRREQATGSAWNSNIRKFHEIITGREDNGEALKCPIFTILGNHEYYANEILMNYVIGAWLIRKFENRDDYTAFNLTPNEGMEYDFRAYPKIDGKDHQVGFKRVADSIAVRKTFKEIKETDAKHLSPSSDETLSFKNWQVSLVDAVGDKTYWLIKPKSWILSQYLSEINYDMDYELKIGNCHLFFFNSGHDRYPSKEVLGSSIDWVRDFLNGGPHCRGITREHVRRLHRASGQLIFVFTHAPLLGLEKAETNRVEYLYEENLKKGNEARNRAKVWLKNLYGMNDNDLQKNGFILNQEGFFKQGERDPYLNFYCADGLTENRTNFLELFFDFLCREPGKSTDRPVLVFSGHTHKVHEFRIERIILPDDTVTFNYYIDDYSGKYFKMTNKEEELSRRSLFLQNKSPLLLTSDAFKNKNPKYREIVVRGASLASLEMKPVTDIEKTGNFTPGCKLIALRAHNGQYVCAEDGGKRELVANRNRIGQWETFEMTQLEDGHVALKACNKKFVRAEGGRGGKLKPDKSWIKDHETFLLVGRGENRIAFRTFNGKYVCAEGGGGRELIANRDQAKEWETFELIEIKPEHITLSAPEQRTPQNGKLFNKEQVITLSWNGVWGAWSYTVEVEEKIRNQWLSKKQERTDANSFSIGFTAVGIYRWRVWAVREDGRGGPKSGWWTFEVRSSL